MKLKKQSFNCKTNFIQGGNYVTSNNQTAKHTYTGKQRKGLQT